MKILSIETSCDETAVSILEASATSDKTTVKILSNIVRSQIEIHKEFGGVYPNLAKREHAKNLPIIFLENLKQANLFETGDFKLDNEKNKILHEMLSHEPGLAEEIINIALKVKKPNLDYLAVTTGPGLEPALWVGINFAKAINFIWGIPVIPINHMEGHILSTLIDSNKTETQEIYLSEFKFPALALLISGGHTELVLIKDWLNYEKIGATKDDAIGEAFDKTARLLGLPYPGGPKISELAKEGVKRDNIKLPRPMIDSGDYNFSFSGIKTSVLYLVKRLGEMDDQTKKDVAREFEEAVTEVLMKKTRDALEEFDVKTLIIGGGVSANTFIKSKMKKMIENNYSHVKLLLPDQHLSTDNSIMIGIAGIFQINNKKEFPSAENIKANSNWSL